MSSAVRPSPACPSPAALLLLAFYCLSLLMLALLPLAPTTRLDVNIKPHFAYLSAHSETRRTVARDTHFDWVTDQVALTWPLTYNAPFDVRLLPDLVSFFLTFKTVRCSTSYRESNEETKINQI